MMFDDQIAIRLIVQGPNGQIKITVENGDPRIEFRKNPLSANPDATIEYDASSDRLILETDYVRSSYGSVADPQPAWIVRVQGAGRGVMLDDTTDSLKATDGNILNETPESWNAVTSFANGWTAGVPAPEYYRDPAGFIHLRGRLVPGVTADSTVMFTLPAAYIPTQVQFRPATQDQAPYNQPAIEVQADGDVAIWSWTAGNVVLDAISFYLF